MSQHEHFPGFHKVALVKIGRSSRTGLYYPHEVLTKALDEYFAKKTRQGEVVSPRYEELGHEAYERRVTKIVAKGVSHELLQEYHIEDNIVYGYAIGTGPFAKTFETMRDHGALNFAMRSLIQTTGNVVKRLEIIAFDLTPDSLTKSKEAMYVARNSNRKVYAYRYMGYLGAVPEFMRNELTEHYAKLDELDHHQAKIEFYPEKYITAENNQWSAKDTRPMLVCNTGDWIIRRDRGGWYDTSTMTNEDFDKNFHSEPLKG